MSAHVLIERGKRGRSPQLNTNETKMKLLQKDVQSAGHVVDGSSMEGHTWEGTDRDKRDACFNSSQVALIKTSFPRIRKSQSVYKTRMLLFSCLDLLYFSPWPL